MLTTLIASSGAKIENPDISAGVSLPSDQLFLRSLSVSDHPELEAFLHPVEMGHYFNTPDLRETSCPDRCALRHSRRNPHPEGSQGRIREDANNPFRSPR